MLSTAFILAGSLGLKLHVYICKWSGRQRYRILTNETSELQACTPGSYAVILWRSEAITTPSKVENRN